jgi:hypothetical protein
LTGLAFSLRRRNVILVAAEAALYSAAIIGIVVVGRYRLPVVLLMLPAAGFALSEIAYTFKSLQFHRTVILILAAAAFAVPVNWQRGGLFLKERTHPDGFRDATAEGTVYRDDSDYLTPFAAVVDEDSSIRKLLIVNDEPTPGQKVTVSILASTEGAGVMKVALNDFERTVPLRPSPRRWLNVTFPADVLEYVNSVDVTCSGGLVARVFADDIFHYGRSFYQWRENEWLDDSFDFRSYRSRPSLHMGGREFKIRITLGAAHTGL